MLLQILAKSADPTEHKQKDKAERIVGKWITEKKNLVVEVYKWKGEFRGRVIWFSDRDDLSKPMKTRMDTRNPDPGLRNRKLLGMEVLKMLKYDSASNSWEDGIIYDSLSGREWNSFAFFTDGGNLRVKGYWHFRFICKSIDFLPYKDEIR